MVGDPLDRVSAAVDRLRAQTPMLRVTIVDDSAENKRGVDRLFDALDQTIDEFPDVLRDALPEIRAAHALNFATEGASGRGKWAALAPRTLRDRRRLGFGPGPILHRTGALEAHVLGTDAVITSSGNTVTLKIKPDRDVDGVPKYDALAAGYAPNNLPGRPMVTVGPASAKKITSAVSRSLRARARANGLR